MVENVSRLRSLLHFGNACAVDTCLSNAVTKMNTAKKSAKPAHQFYDDADAASLMQEGLYTIRGNDEVSWANARDALGLFNRICTAQLVRLSDGQTSAASQSSPIGT